MRLAPDARAIGRAIATARGFAQAHALPAEAADRLAIVVEEWVANVVEHGHPAPGSRIVLRLEAGRDGVRLAISDAGRAFDPCKAEDKGPNAMRGGGVGIAMIRSWCEMAYARRGGRNRLTLTLKPG